MSFCRITGKCRSLPKPNYFPMLPPISPAAAKRFCRVTGKSYGLPSHHFIPVSLVKRSAGADRCRVTNVSAELEPHHYQPGAYGRRRHEVLCAFRYVLPVLDDSDEAQRNLTTILQQKTKPLEQSLYVYRVDERNFGLVFPARLEAAVRDGDVRDVLLAKESDKLLIKLRKGNSVSVPLQSFEHTAHEPDALYEGEGPRDDVIKRREKEDAKRPKPKSKSNLSSIANIFESKERVEEEQIEQEQRFIEEHREKAARLASERRERQRAEKLQALRLNEHLLEQDPELGDLVKPLIESWDWSTLEREAADRNAESEGVRSTVSALPKPLNVLPVVINARKLTVDEAQLEHCSGLEAASYVGTITPAKVDLKPDRIAAINALTPEMLSQLAQLEDRLAASAELLPHLDDLASVMSHLGQAQPTEVDGVPGVKLIVNHQSVFVPGQMVMVGGKPTFVPGQSLPSSSSGSSNELEFIPGVTITGHDGTIQFIPGEVTTVRAGSKQPSATFVAGKVIEGQGFVCGQVLSVNGEPRFVQGQTIVTPEGVSKFIAGVVDERTGQFVPGQPIETPDGLRFVPGQTITVQGRERFIPGQNVPNPDGKGELVFVPGQTVSVAGGEDRFVPGKTIVTAEGSRFVPGQYVGDSFVPGIVDAGGRFVPGVNIETKEGSKFVEGQIVHTKHGDVFMPGTTTVGPAGEVSFALASTIDAVRFSEASPVGLVVDGDRLAIEEPSLCVFGHLVQNDTGVEFYPERIGREHLPAGKVVPGKLVKQLAESKFIPGIKTEDDGFIPGQVVLTDRGEQFVPGQVIETSEGMKFVPGQIIETKSGPKFVPGQTMETPDGPRFVPGQIINTRVGPTFIPGQVISTDDDGEKFVPGQIVDTDDGPRFVPGRVVESENRVTFIPGRIVQTADGPRFVAPDLKDNEDGDEEFSVQSFTVTPEELKLLKPSQPAYGGAVSGESTLVVSLDSTILQSLAQSGMPIGRQVEASAVDYVLESTKERKALQQFLAENSLPGAKLDVLESIFDGLKQVCRKVDRESLQYSDANAPKDETVCNGSIGVVEALAASLATILTSESQANSDPNAPERTMYEMIAEAIKASTGEYTVEELQHVIQSPEAVDYLFGAVNRTIVKNNIDQKLRTLTALMEEEPMGEDAEAGVGSLPTGAIEEFCELLDNGGMSEAFVNLLKKDENLFRSIVTSLKSSGVVEDSVNISEILQTALVDSIQERAQAALVELVEDPRSHDALRTLLRKSEGLAHALGHAKEAEALQYLLTHPAALRDLHKEDELFTIINRVLIMEQLAEDDDEYRELMDSLERTPAHATKSDKLRELIRQSGALSHAPARRPVIESSRDVPLSLFYTNNQLAIEEFFLKSGQCQRRQFPKAFLIIKRGIQAVIPRESSHEVLAGKIAYTVLDEDGIRHFQPMNVLSALRITPKFLHRFSMYTCEMQEEPDYETLSSSGSSSHDALDKVDEGAYYYRPLSRRGSLRVPTTNAHNVSAHRKLERQESFSPRLVSRKLPPVNGYHPVGSLPPLQPLYQPLHTFPTVITHHQHLQQHVPPRQHQQQHHHHHSQHYQPAADNVKQTLPMAMRIAIKASLAQGRDPSSTCYRSSSRDSIHRSSSRASVHDWNWK
ncbi:uncharacterized protein LOC118509021 isoform X1 [Anopheles stephensi]|uniref:uncharacterized protein LOC118509021 isoform X1 n=1 Tax=Anopheles stephensi TaxID=30069 RepID=UPI0016588212|nr:uncharacterized protein LOC118509021 isoform X1 [Anopheles stephensi]